MSLMQVSEKVVELLFAAFEDEQEPAANATPPTAKQEPASNATPPTAKQEANATKSSPPSNSSTSASNATNVTNTSEASTTPAPTGCVTKEDPRIKAWFTETSPAGTPCVFGVDGDVRDEGSHCIFDNGQFGSNGWCYTAKDRSSWGSCGGNCPLYGPSKQLASKIDHVDKKVDEVAQALDKVQGLKGDAAENSAKATDQSTMPVPKEASETGAKKEPKVTTAAPGPATPPGPKAAPPGPKAATKDTKIKI